MQSQKHLKVIFMLLPQLFLVLMPIMIGVYVMYLCRKDYGVLFLAARFIGIGIIWQLCIRYLNAKSLAREPK